MANKHFFKCFKWAILWAAVIAALMMMPGQSIPKYSWTKYLMLDKWMHLFLYAVLVVLLYLGGKKFFSYDKLLFRNILNFFLIAAVYSILVEIVQGAFADQRSFDYLDIAANLSGCFFGGLIVAYLKNKMYI